MSEKPILFSAPMVRAILDGTKTQTRRVIKPQPCGTGWYDRSKDLRSPYQVGDLLWVRETFRMGTAPRDEAKQGIALYEDGTHKAHPDLAPDRLTWCRAWKTKPSIFMPRWASRITLRVTNVRVQRVQDISEDDAAAEGIQRHSGPYILDFAALWDSINEKRGYGWNSNPWVWAYTFQREEVSG